MDVQAFEDRGSQRRTYTMAIGLGFFALGQRILIRLLYQPISYGDTSSYLRLANQLRDLSFSGYDGTRVPGYPILLRLLDFDPQRIWNVQLLLGVSITMLLFWIGLRTVGSPLFGLVLGGLYSLIPGLFLFESNLLTETLTTFFVVLSLVFFVAMDRVGTSPSGYIFALAVGVAASLAGLVRPIFFILPVWYFLFVLLARNIGSPVRWLRAAVFSIGPLLLLGGWLLVIQSSYHMLAPTVMGGFHLVQHTGEYFEDLPDEYSDLRDTYLEFRDAQIEARGTQANAIWEAIPAMRDASGLSFYDLSRTLQRLSIGLILANPLLYLSNVAEGWVDFWKAPIYWRPDSLANAVVVQVLRLAGLAGRALSVAANALFLFLVAGAVLLPSVRARFNVDRYTIVAGGMVLLVSIVQTLVDHGDNPRFLVPLQMMVIFVVGRAIWFGLYADEQME